MLTTHHHGNHSTKKKPRHSRLFFHLPRSSSLTHLLLHTSSICLCLLEHTLVQIHDKLTTSKKLNSIINRVARARRAHQCHRLSVCSCSFSICEVLAKKKKLVLVTFSSQLHVEVLDVLQLMAKKITSFLSITVPSQIQPFQCVVVFQVIS